MPGSPITGESTIIDLSAPTPVDQASAGDGTLCGQAGRCLRCSRASDGHKSDPALAHTIAGNSVENLVTNISMTLSIRPGPEGCDVDASLSRVTIEERKFGTPLCILISSLRDLSRTTSSKRRFSI